MPRLLALTTSQEDGGAESHLRTTLAAAAARGWDLTVALPGRAATAGLRNELRAAGADVIELELGRQASTSAAALRALLADLLDAGRTIATVRPDAILLNVPTPEASPGMLLAAALSRRRTTAIFHLVRADLAVNPRRQPLYRLAGRGAQRWVCVSYDNSATLARAFGVAPERIAVVHNGVAPVAVAPGRREAVRDALGLAATDVLVLTTARLAAQKDHRVIVEALPRLVEREPGLVFAWAGDGPERDALAAQLAATGLERHVRLLGRRDDVPELLAAADLFLFPSRDEGGPTFALLEAFAAAVPAIVSDLGALTEVVRDRENGLVFARGDADDLVRVLDWALAHPRELAAMATRAAEQARAEYSAEAMAAGLLAQVLPPAPAHASAAPG